MDILKSLQAIIDKRFIESEKNEVTEEQFEIEDYLAVYRAIEDYTAQRPQMRDMIETETQEVAELAVRQLLHFLQNHIIVAAMNKDLSTPLQIKHTILKVLCRAVRKSMPPNCDLVIEILRWG